MLLFAEFDEDMQSETGSRYSLANISRNSSVSNRLYYLSRWWCVHCHSTKCLKCLICKLQSLLVYYYIRSTLLYLWGCNTKVVWCKWHSYCKSY